jgi:hypothetical protein
MPTDTLTPAEIAEITGKRRAAAQAAALAKLGIPFAFLGRAVRVSREVASAHDLLPQTSKRPDSGGVNLALVR